MSEITYNLVPVQIAFDKFVQHPEVQDNRDALVGALYKLRSSVVESMGEDAEEWTRPYMDTVTQALNSSISQYLISDQLIEVVKELINQYAILTGDVIILHKIMALAGLEGALEELQTIQQAANFNKEGLKEFTLTEAQQTALSTINQASLVASEQRNKQNAENAISLYKRDQQRREALIINKLLYSGLGLAFLLPGIFLVGVGTILTVATVAGGVLASLAAVKALLVFGPALIAGCVVVGALSVLFSAVPFHAARRNTTMAQVFADVFKTIGNFFSRSTSQSKAVVVEQQEPSSNNNVEAAARPVSPPGDARVAVDYRPAGGSPMSEPLDMNGNPVLIHPSRSRSVSDAPVTKSATVSDSQSNGSTSHTTDAAPESSHISPRQRGGSE